VTKGQAGLRKFLLPPWPLGAEIDCDFPPLQYSANSGNFRNLNRFARIVMPPSELHDGRLTAIHFRFTE
jgi:hypothetical protein